MKSLKLVVLYSIKSYKGPDHTFPGVEQWRIEGETGGENKGKNMKAVVKIKKGKGFVEYKEMPRPQITEDEVLIGVKAVSVCGSDIHIYHDEHPNWPPMIMGHELSGVIAEVGSRVKNRKTGDRVVTETRTKSCGICLYCETGKPHICPDKRPLGIGVDGAMAKYVAVPGKLIHRLPETIGFVEASLCEPLAVCVHGLIERTGINAGDTVLISGPGPIGLICLQLAKAAGAYVLVAGTSRSADLKLKRAMELGADEIIDAGKENVVERVKKASGGYGADVVVEASGAPLAIKTAFESLRRQGKLCAMGITGKPAAEMPWDTAIFKAAQVTFCFSSSWSGWETGIKMLERKQINLAKLVTHELPLEKWKEGFEAMEAGKAIKVVLIP